MPKFLNDIDFSNNKAENMVIQPLSSAPANPKQGQVYFNTTDNNIYRFDGTKWVTYQEVLDIETVTEVELADVAFSGDAEDLIWPDPLVLYCGTSTEVVS